MSGNGNRHQRVPIREHEDEDEPRAAMSDEELLDKVAKAIMFAAVPWLMRSR